MNNANFPNVTSSDIRDIIKCAMDVTLFNQANGLRFDNPVVCVWGPKGIGKTQVIESIARSNDWQYVSVPIGQFEETGDLHGLPKQAGDRTKYMIPSWVPVAEGPGILFFDDFNRADVRILNGIMQLLQDGKLISWELPKGWIIVLSANPDRDGYQVSSLDEAHSTRISHYNMRFDVDEWLDWAFRANVDQRAIAFMQYSVGLAISNGSNPSICARTFTNFANNVRMLNWDTDSHLVKTICSAHMGTQATTLLSQFLMQRLDNLPSIKTILKTKKIDDIKQLFDTSKEEIWSSRNKCLSASVSKIMYNRIKAHFEINLFNTTSEDEIIESFNILWPFVKLMQPDVIQVCKNAFLDVVQKNKISNKIRDTSYKTIISEIIKPQ